MDGVEVLDRQPGDAHWRARSWTTGILWGTYPMGVFIAGLVYPTSVVAILPACAVLVDMVEVRGVGRFPLEQLRCLIGVHTVRENGDGLEIRVDERRRRLDQVIRCLQQAGVVLQNVGVQETNLVEVFVELVQ